MGTATASALQWGAPAIRPSLHLVPLRTRVATDDAWFAELYEEHFDRVFRFVTMMVHDPCRAEDIVADVYLRAWRARQVCDRERPAIAWLLGIARNRVIDESRARRPMVSLDNVAEPVDEHSDLLHEQLAAADAQELRAAMQQLTDEQQQVIFLRFFQGESHDVVARQLGRNENAVRALQFRALSRLRKILEETHAR